MSMHAIEDMVQGAVEVLDRHLPADDPRVRDWFVALYAFQFGYDCSLTQHRVLEILLRRGHTLRFPVSEHPDYARRREFFDGITEFTTLREFGADEEEFAGELEEGYVDPPWLYCEAGTGLWRRMAGPGAVQPRQVRLLDVVVAVARAAERDGDVELIALWWALGHEALVGGHPLSADELAGIPGVEELRAVVRRTRAHEAKLWYDLRPDDESLDETDDELTTWWYRVDRI
ncbi:hypothetical protein [Actinoplanes subglobosus]|uniref:Uncharacterized protein n=1 Tax=Actinoplanes subglobosus TaxID=1547892 RepID=A0ABV8INB2_9ACTN